MIPGLQLHSFRDFLSAPSHPDEENSCGLFKNAQLQGRPRGRDAGVLEPYVEEPATRATQQMAFFNSPWIQKYQKLDTDQKIDFCVSLFIYAAIIYSGVSVFRATRRLWRSNIPNETAFLSGLGIFLKQGGSGFISGLKGLKQSFRNGIRDATIQKKFLVIGGVSGVTRWSYDRVTGNDEEAWSNAAKAFAFGGLCGGLKPTVPKISNMGWANRTLVPFLTKAIPFHYIGLDLLGSLSQKYLTDVRQKYGETAGWGMTIGGLFLSGTLATFSFLPFTQSVTGASFLSSLIKTTLPIIVVSCLMEATIQRSNGKRWKDIDPGRFVGMSAWGFSVVVLPESLLHKTTAVTIAETFTRTTDLWARYLFFINPSAANFSAIINDQHWWNAQLGNFTRQGTVMFGSRYVQTTFGASALTSIIADETLGALSILATNAIWRLYEGRSTMWKEELKRLIQATDGTPEAYDRLTEFMSTKMGSLKNGDYLPSPLNLNLLNQLMQEKDWIQHQIRFRQYLYYLSRKPKRSPAEELILKTFISKITFRDCSKMSSCKAA